MSRFTQLKINQLRVTFGFACSTARALRKGPQVFPVLPVCLWTRLSPQLLGLRCITFCYQWISTKVECMHCTNQTQQETASLSGSRQTAQKRWAESSPPAGGLVTIRSILLSRGKNRVRAQDSALKGTSQNVGSPGEAHFPCVLAV